MTQVNEGRLNKKNPQSVIDDRRTDGHNKQLDWFSCSKVTVKTPEYVWSVDLSLFSCFLVQKGSF